MQGYRPIYSASAATRTILASRYGSSAIRAFRCKSGTRNAQPLKRRWAVQTLTPITRLRGSRSHGSYSLVTRWRRCWTRPEPITSGRSCFPKSKVCSPSSEYGAFLTVSDMAELLEVSRFVIDRMLKTGRLPAAKLGGQYRVRTEDFFKWWENEVKQEQKIF